MFAPTPVMIPRLLFAQTPHKGLVRCLKLQPQLVKAGSEPSFGFICTDAKSPPRTPAPSTIIIPRSPFAQMPPEGLALPVPLCLLRERGRSQQLSTGHLPRCHVQRVELMPIGRWCRNHKGWAPCTRKPCKTCILLPVGHLPRWQMFRGWT